MLPNVSSYTETCAILMFLNLNHRWFMATGDARYIDLLERGMYNNMLDGVSHSGDHFFYVNRLASAGDGRDERWQHASLECCPPNLVRFLASMPGMIYAQDQAGVIHVNLYVSSEASFRRRRRHVASGCGQPDALARPHADQGRRRRTAEDGHKLAHPRLGARTAGAGRPLSLHGSGERPVTITVNGASAYPRNRIDWVTWPSTAHGATATRW